MKSKFRPIDNVKLNKAVEFMPYVNSSGSFSQPLDESELFILDANRVKPFIDELNKLNQLHLIEETLQGLSQRMDGTLLNTAFPDIESFKLVVSEMDSIPQELKGLLEKWVSLGAHEIHINFEEKPFKLCRKSKAISRKPMGKCIPADNWFAILDPWSNEPGAGANTIEIYRVVLWKQTETGVVGLISPPLNGGELEQADNVMPCSGVVYKHLNDLNELESEALKIRNNRR